MHSFFTGSYKCLRSRFHGEFRFTRVTILARPARFSARPSRTAFHLHSHREFEYNEAVLNFYRRTDCAPERRIARPIRGCGNRGNRRERDRGLDRGTRRNVAPSRCKFFFFPPAANYKPRSHVRRAASRAGIRTARSNAR